MIEDRIASLENQLTMITDKLNVIIKQNKSIMEKQSQFDDNITNEMNRVFDRVGGDELSDIMTKIQNIDFDSVVYVCDQITTYRKNGVISLLRRPSLT